MIYLEDFFRSFSQNEKLLDIAKAVHAKVLHVRMDANAKGLEFTLDLMGSVPDGTLLVELENGLRSALSISHIRLFLSGFPQEQKAPAAMIHPLLPWILTAIKRENPILGSLVASARFENRQMELAGHLYNSMDTDLETEFTERLSAFMEKYLEVSCPFVWEYNNMESSVSPAVFAREQAEKLMRDAHEAILISDQLQSMAPPQEHSVNPMAKNKFGTGAGAHGAAQKPKPAKSRQDVPGSIPMPDAPVDRGQGAPMPPEPPPVNQDSWAFKAKEAAKENKTVFTRTPKADGVLWGKGNPTLPAVKIGDMDSNTGLVLFDGHVEIEEFNLTKSGSKVRVNFFVTDDTGCIACVYFMQPQDADEFEKLFEKGGYARFQANVYFDDRYSRDLQASVEGVMEKEAPNKRQDLAALKRVELHCHSKMSEKDAVIDVSRLFMEASRMGHPACALTDHGVVQGFPEAAETYKKINGKKPENPFKVIYGMEGYLVDDGPCIAYHSQETDTLDDGYIAVDVETTGFDCAADALLEIGAVHFVRDESGTFVPGDIFHTFVNPGRDIPGKITELTGITPFDVEGAPDPVSAVRAFSEFAGDRPICGHNVLFDLSFLRTAGFSVDIEKHEAYRVKFNPVAIDTVALARAFYAEISNYKLATVADYLKITLVRAHRADSDAMTCGIILSRVLRDFDLNTPFELNEKAGKLGLSEIVARKQKVHHVILLAQNALGLYHMYRMVSESHTQYFNMRPRIPKSVLEYFKAGLIIGSACERGEIFTRVLSYYRANGNQYDLAKSAMLQDREFIRMARFYDYLEIQPLSNNEFYLRNPESGLTTIEDLKNLNRLIVMLGEHMSLPVCATTDAHFMEKDEGEYRKYILMDMGYKDAEFQSDLYFRTTPEMIQEFAYLGEDKAFEVVVKNTNDIADRIEAGLKPFPDGTYPPIIDTAADDIRNLTWDAAKELYEYKGEITPIVKARVEKELQSIIGNGFAIMYYIAYRLVKKSNEDGYIVGSRGSVGSSLVATLCGISEVNPLPPHTLCPNCRYSIFDESGQYGSGYDLPQIDCPKCGTRMRCEGQDIPFETFLGFYGDKQPDIDLNFSSEYQSRAHKYVEELFGQSHTFRAGTIGCFADKNAVAVVNKIQESSGMPASKAELRRRSLGLIGVKRTTGQHPGGIVVVPKEMDVFEFTPIQHPANKLTCGTTTTHFDFNAMHDTILKLDILGHYDPTMLRMLSDLTGVDVRTIPIPDEKVMSLFVSTEALGIPDGTSEAKSATLGLSEMGTFMARDMITETRPTHFYDLVQLMGLSHGTDVWKGNAQDLIQNGTCTLNSVIGCRDGIMTQLIYWGLPNKASFDIMEKVRKGKGLSAEHEALMREKEVPEWYIDSCKKIKYMFPKAHAAAYAISSLRIAWFKVYYPEEYYCSFFTIRADEFDGDIMCNGLTRLKAKRKELYEGFVTRKPNEKAMYYLCELVEEMYARGIEFLPYDILKSDAVRFQKAGKGKILPPLNAIPTISAAIAQSIAKAREDGPFKTRDELLRRSGIGPTAMAKIISTGCVDHLPDSAQIDLFSLM